MIQGINVNANANQKLLTYNFPLVINVL